MSVELSLLRRLAIFLHAASAVAVAVFSLTVAAACVWAADDDDDLDAPPERQIEDGVAIVASWISDEAVSRQNFEMLLRRRIAFVDRVCNLTDAQKQKLEFASRGDVKRFLDRLHEIDMRVQLAEIAPAEVTELVRESQQIKSGTSTVRSLLANVPGKLLTPEQLARYEPLRMVIHVGGRIQTEDPESDDVVEIDVQGTEFTDNGAAHFREFPRLSRLLLANTRVADDGLAHVQGLTNLQWLDIAGTQVTDTGLKYLKGLTHLQWLSLARTHVTDAGLVHLKELAGLQSLDLDGSRVTDAGLPHLAKLTGLERLYVRHTQVTDLGVARLQRALPQLTIHVRDRHWQGNRRQGAMGFGFF